MPPAGRIRTWQCEIPPQDPDSVGSGDLTCAGVPAGEGSEHAGTQEPRRGVHGACAPEGPVPGPHIRVADLRFIGRLWRSLTQECAGLHAWKTGSQARAGLGHRIIFPNHHRPHTAHCGHPPAVVCINAIETGQQVQAAASLTRKTVQRPGRSSSHTINRAAWMTRVPSVAVWLTRHGISERAR